MSTPLPHSLDQFAEHAAGFVRENLEQQTMKNTTNLQVVADQIKAEYHPEDERLNKAIEIVKSQGLFKLLNGNIQVPSSTDTNHRYQVSLVRKECNCRDYTKRHTVDSSHLCKHILAALIWTMLPDMPVTSVEIEEIKSFLFGTPLNVKVTV